MSLEKISPKKTTDSSPEHNVPCKSIAVDQEILQLRSMVEALAERVGLNLSEFDIANNEEE